MAGASNGGGIDAADLEAQIEAARTSLAANIDALAERAAPSALAANAKSKAMGIVRNPDGSIRTDRAVMIGGAGFLLVTVILWRRFH